MSLQQTRPIFFHVLINAPRLCKSMNMNVKNDERVFDLIYRVVNNAGLIETNQYKLYGLSDRFVEIPPESLCSSLFLTSYDSLYLFGKPIEHLFLSTIYFETKKTIVTGDMHSETTKLVALAIKCLKISIDGTFYVLYDPKTSEIYPYDEVVKSSDDSLTEQHVKFVLKQFCTFVSQFIFCPTLINSGIEDENESIQKCLELISKDKISIFLLNEYFIPPTFKTLLSKVHDQISKKEPFILSELNFSKIEMIFNNYDNENCINTLSNEEANSFLFYLLSMYQKPYISEPLHNKIIQVLKNFKTDGSDDVEIFYNIRAFLALMPLCTQCILLELCKCFELISSEKSVIQLVTRSMIPSAFSKDFDVEQRFFAFVLMFCESLFYVPNSDTLYLSQSGKLVFDDQEDDELTPFRADRNIFDTIESLVDKPELTEPFNGKKFAKLNVKLEDVANLEDRKKELLMQIKEKLES